MFDEWTYKDTIGFTISVTFSYYFFGPLITLIGFLFIANELRKNGESNV